MTRVQFLAEEIRGFFLFITTSGPLLGPTHPPIQWILGALTPVGKIAMV
jgi:hypothetical protein